MTIKSEPTRGLIYAGDTSLACSIGIEQTGPMQLTVRAGAFTTTGQAQIVDAADVVDPSELIDAGRAEMLPDGQRMRIWLQDGDSTIFRSETLTLAEDAVFDLAANPEGTKYYKGILGFDLNLGGEQGVYEVLLLSRFDGDEYPAYPEYWEPRQEIIYEFMVPPCCADLADIDIYVLRVEPGFPPGTGPADWQTQAGGA